MGKRSANNQITKDDGGDYDSDASGSGSEEGRVSTAEEIAARKIFKVKRKVPGSAGASNGLSAPVAAVPAMNWSFTATPAATATAAESKAPESTATAAASSDAAATTSKDAAETAAEPAKDEGAKAAEEPADKTAAASTTTTAAADSGSTSEAAESKSDSASSTSTSSTPATAAFSFNIKPFTFAGFAAPTTTTAAAPTTAPIFGGVSTFFPSATGSTAASPFSFSFGSAAATGSAFPTFSTFKPAAAAASANDEEGGDDEEDDGEAKPQSCDITVEGKAGPVLPEISVQTGEEDEEVVIESEARLFRLQETGNTRKWAASGTGKLTVNVFKDTPSKCRLLMREEKIQKVILNVPILKKVMFKLNEKTIQFLTFGADGAAGAAEKKFLPTSMSFRTASEAAKVHAAIVKCQDDIQDA